jgi:protein-L-isoaspartate(D-aspartate) O-methyltransferase
MVDEQLIPRGITDRRVLEAMRAVPRHQFVSPEQRAEAYDDRPLPIGNGQTISQPYIVALMTQLAAPMPADRALDVGTGSGYQAAVLAELVDTVDSVEIVPDLAERARGTLRDLGYRNVEVHLGDGSIGLPGEAPYNLILAAAAPDAVPAALVELLAPGGRLVMPVGGDRQMLMLVRRLEDGSIAKSAVSAVSFVPMTGAAGRSRVDEENR